MKLSTALRYLLTAALLVALGLTVDSTQRSTTCVLVVADLILAMLLFVAFPDLKGGLREDFRYLREMFGGRFKTEGSLGRVLRNPVTGACAFVFLVATAVAWIAMSRAAYRAAQSRLSAAAADLREAVNTCADNLLFYQGHAIVNRYLRPEAMTVSTAQEIMRQYGLDELNVVNSNGVVLVGALADVGFDFHSNRNTRSFLCLLAGEKTYAQPFRAPIEDPHGMRRKYAGIAFPYPAKGFIQVGFDESRLKHGIDYWFRDLAKDHHIGHSGYHIVADAETGNVLSCGITNEEGDMCFHSGFTLAMIGYDAASVPRRADEFFVANLFGERCLCLSEELNYHRLVSVLPFREIRAGVRHIILLSSGILFCVFTLVVFFMTKLMNLVRSLREKERAERERQEKDLAVARTIQTSSLPPVFPDCDDWCLFARMDPAREVGGDFFDFFVMPSGRVFFLIADVSGKGIPAAMFMMKAKAMIRAAVNESKGLAEAIAEANDRLAENNDANMFVTAWIGLFDPQTGRLEYVNAGHNPPLLKLADASVEWIRGKRGLVLAAMGGVPYRVETLALNRGDSIFLYTDGVTEAMNAAGELYGEGRLERALSVSEKPFVSDIRADLAAFVQGAEQSDDITMLTLDFKKKTGNVKH